VTRRPIELRPCGPEGGLTLRAYAGELAAAADRARQRVGVSETTLLVAGVTVRLRFLGDALRPVVLPALGHHARDADRESVDLVVDLWDGVETGVRRPAYTAGGEAGGVEPPAVLAEYRTDTDTVFVLDTATKRAYVCVGDASRLPSYERSSPLLPLLHWALARHGVQVVHGGAVAVDGSAVLVAGPGGTGKSTTCLSVIGSSAVYLADDYCALVPTSRGVAVSGLSAIGKIGWEGPDRLETLGPRVLAPGHGAADKALIDVSDIVRLSHRRPMRLAAVVVPDLAGVATRRRPEFERIQAAAALRALAPTTLAQLPGAGPGALRAIAEAVRSVPSFRLWLAGDVTTIPDAIVALIEEAGGS
jgi:hypothetical protein